MTVLAVAAPVAVRAQVFYAFPRATTQKKGEVAVGPYIAFGDNELFRLSGYGRFYLVDYLDAGVEVIVDNVSGDFRGGAGFDVKYQLFPDNRPQPFDLSANTGLGFTSGAGVKTFNVPFGVIAATPYKLDSGAEMVPYVGVYLIYVYSSVDSGTPPKVTDNDFDVEARIGLSYAVNEVRQVFATLHVGTDLAVFFGFNFDLK